MPVEHSHASFSLKVILLIFAILLVGVLGYLVWDYQRMPDLTDYSTPITVTETEMNTTASWLTYTDEENGYTFQYPSNYSYKKVAGYVQVYKTGGIDTVGPTFRYTKYGESLAADENDPPLKIINITDFSKLKEYMEAIGYKNIADKIVSGRTALFIDEDSPQGKGKYYGYLVDGGAGYYSLDDHQDLVSSSEKEILLSFKLIN